MSSHSPRLLLVDDDPSAIQILSRMLAAQYPDRRYATSGVDALRMAREDRPDLILLDADMPGMTGLEVCAALKADPSLAQVPIIFATSHDTPHMEVAALGLGAVDFVTKPLLASQVLARVRARLQGERVVADAEHDRRAAGASAGDGVRQPRLLIVDGDEGALRMMYHTLVEIGEIHYARRGDEALEVARRLAPDLIILDPQLPGVDGVAVCETLKAEAAFQHVPIVMVTCLSDPRSEQRAFEVGAADYITKPYVPAVVLARVRNLLDCKCRTDAELQTVRDQGRRLGDARVADIVNAASDAIVSHDAAGTVLLANAAACHMFEARHAQLIGRSIQSLLGAGFEAAAALPLEAVRITLPRGSGAGLKVEAALSTVGEGARRLTTVMLRDVSDRDRLDQLERARLELETVGRTKSQMLSCIAHEMSNPLNGLLGFAQLMQADTTHPLPAEQAARLDLVVASGQRLQVLLHDVVDLGRFESGALAIEACPIDAAAAVAAAAAAVSCLAARADVALSCPPQQQSLHVLADAGRLQQCLANLLTNAIKYNRRGGSVDIEVGEQGPQIAIAVRDNGLGIDALQMAHLFEPFNRLGRQRSTTPGTGLGLWITRQLVAAMGGRLRVDSEAGQGSCFTLLLPRVPGAPTAGESPRLTDNH